MLSIFVKSRGRCLSKSGGIVPVHKILILEKLADYFTKYSYLKVE